MTMVKSFKKNSGFTLVEVLVSVGILLIFLPFAASMLTNSQLLASNSKHKIQAAYAAQQIIETLRQKPISYFAPILSTAIPNNAPTIITEWVMLDTKGNYPASCNSANIPCGTATVTISPETYINSAGQKTNYTAVYQPVIGAAITYYTIAHIAVNINWTEQIVKTKVPVNENYAADVIVNDPLLN